MTDITKIEIIENCVCFDDLKKQAEHPNKKIEAQQFKRGDVLAVKYEWSDGKRDFYRVETKSKKGFADIEKRNASKLYN